MPQTHPLQRLVDRRRVLQLGGLSLGGAALAACGSSKASSPPAVTPTTGAASASGAATSAAADLGTLDFRLSWIKNVEFAGEYFADKNGYYAAQGFSKVNLISGGPSATPQETDVVTGKAFIGISAPDITGAAVAKGAPLTIIGAQYQKNPFAIMSMAKTPITTPQEMIGKKIGVQATNESVWTAFLKANNIDPSKITKVPVQFDPLPLTQGTVDGWFSFVTNEPNDLTHRGFKVTSFLLADFNYPLVSETYMVKTDDLQKNPDKVKAALIADIKGWKDVQADPQKAADITANTYGKGLGLDASEQVLEAKSEIELIFTDDTKTNGLFTITPALIEANIKTLGIAGIKATDSLFDTSIIDSIYKDDPTLI